MRFLKSNCLGIGVVIIMLVSTIGCLSRASRLPTAEEIDLARRGVVALLETSARGAGGGQFLAGSADALESLLVPPDALAIWEAAAFIPGGLRMRTLCIEATAAAASEAVTTLIPIAVQLASSIDLQDPYALVKGKSDSATNYFESLVRTQLEVAAEDALGQSESDAVSRAQSAWDRLRTLVAIQEQATNRIGRTGFTILPPPTVSFAKPVAKAVVEVFFQEMREQEDLVRATAAFYDSPEIAIFYVQ